MPSRHRLEKGLFVLHGDAQGIHRRRLLVGVLVVITFAALVLPQLDGTTAAATSPLTWSGPVRVDHVPPFSGTTALNGIACPTTTLCAAVDGSGDVVTSTNPTGGSSAWTVSNVDGSHALPGIACPTTTLCVAVDGSGDVVTSTNPTGGSSAWTVSNVDATNTLTGVSCATTTLCAAVDGDGNVVVSTNPVGGASAWKVYNVDFVNGFTGISCPTGSTLCVAVDNQGNVVTSTDPSGGTSEWTVADVGGGSPLESVACPTTTGCVAVGFNVVYVSTKPTGGASAWLATDLSTGISLVGVGCATTPGPLCAAVDTTGDVAVSSNPTGGSSAWTLADIDGTEPLVGIACPASTLCVAVDKAGNAVTSTNPVGGSSTWTTAVIDGTNSLYAVSCTTTPSSLCIAVDDLGSIVTATNPAGGAAGWTETKIDGHTLFDVSCATSNLCVAVDAAGNVLTSTDPTGGASAWKAATIDGTTDYLYGVSCTTTPSTLCVAVDDVGNVFASTNPTGGASAWKIVDTGGGVLPAVSCASATLCVAVNTSGYVLTSTNPTGGASAWSESFIDTNTSNSLYGVSCTTNPTTLCVAVDASEDVWTSTHPSAGASAWSGAPAESAGVALDSVSCASTTLCVAVDGGGDALTSTNPSGGINAWSVDEVEPCTSAERCGTTASGIPLNGVSCPSSSLCIAVDSGGNVVAGTGAKAVAPSITSQPTNLTVASGQTATFSAAAGGTPTPTVQWQDSTNGTTWSNLSGDTSTALSFVASSSENGVLYRAVFTNSSGSATTNAAKLTVTQAPPTTSVVVPANGATVKGTTTLDATSTNATSVEFWLLGGSYGYSGKLLGTATLSAYGWLDSWNTTTVPDASYALLSEAFNSGSSAYSTPISVTVNNPPTTSVVVPASGATVKGTTTLDATSTNATSVEFWLLGGSYGYSGKLLGTATLSAYGWLDSWNTTTVPDGSYALLSEAFNSGSSAYSTPISITVNN